MKKLVLIAMIGCSLLVGCSGGKETIEVKPVNNTSTVNTQVILDAYKSKLEEIANAYNTGSLVGDNFLLEVIADEEDGKYNVTINFDDNSNRFDEIKRCAYVGFDFQTHVELKDKNMSNKIKTYNFSFFSEGVKKYSTSIDNTAETHNEINLVSEETGETTIVTRQEVTAFIEEAKKELNNSLNAQTQESNKENTSVPTEYKSALKKAETYSNMMNMSKARLYEQLTSEYGEKFSHEAAQYAIDNVVADWKRNALEKAKTYQDEMAMSPSAIYDQLISEYGERFTEEEAQYAIDNLE